RQLRNRAVHGAGVVDQELADARSRLAADAPAAERDWERVARVPLPSFTVGDGFEMRELDGRAALYAAGNAARDVNWRVWQALSRTLVADVVVAEYRSTSPPHGWTHTLREERVPRLAHGAYAPLNLTDSELSDAMQRSRGPAPPTMGAILHG